MMNFSIILCIMIFIYIILYYIYIYPYKFLNKKESYEILCNNDEFYKKFTKTDLMVRDVKNIDEYISRIKKDVYNFSLYDKFRIGNCCRKADYIILKKQYPWFDGKKASKIKWIFSCTGQYYEKGFPHTLMGLVIVLPRKILDDYDDDQLIRTLIHEKVHLYQYKYRDDLNKYIDMNDFKIHKERELKDNTRVNPDTDNYIYKRGNIYYKAEFVDNPKTLNDIILYKNRYEYEHPFEEMAIDISSNIEK